MYRKSPVQRGQQRACDVVTRLRPAPEGAGRVRLKAEYFACVRKADPAGLAVWSAIHQLCLEQVSRHECRRGRTSQQPRGINRKLPHLIGVDSLRNAPALMALVQLGAFHLSSDMLLPSAKARRPAAPCVFPRLYASWESRRLALAESEAVAPAALLSASAAPSR